MYVQIVFNSNWYVVNYYWLKCLVTVSFTFLSVFQSVSILLSMAANPCICVQMMRFSGPNFKFDVSDVAKSRWFSCHNQYACVYLISSKHAVCITTNLITCSIGHHWHTISSCAAHGLTPYWSQRRLWRAPWLRPDSEPESWPQASFRKTSYQMNVREWNELVCKWMGYKLYSCKCSGTCFDFSWFDKWLNDDVINYMLPCHIRIPVALSQESPTGVLAYKVNLSHSSDVEYYRVESFCFCCKSYHFN